MRTISAAQEAVLSSTAASRAEPMRVLVKTPTFAAAGHVVDANTLALWRLDEALAADNAADSSGNGYTLTQTGSPPVAAGLIGNARAFDGGAKYLLHAGDAASRLALRGEITVEAWVRRAAGNEVYVLDGSPNGGAGNMPIQVNANTAGGVTAYWNKGTGGSAVSVAIGSTWAASADEWHHIAVRRRHVDGVAFVDFLLDGGASSETHGPYVIPNVDAGDTAAMAVGRGPGPAYSTGDLDDVHISQCARTDAEIRADYERGQGYYWRDLTAWPGQNLVDSASWRKDSEGPHTTCDVLLRRDAGLLSLAPLRSGSALNRGFDPAASYVPLLAIGREFKAEVALCPADQSPTADEWLPVFHGRIDTIDSAGEQISIGGRDLGGRLADAWFEVERVYAFGSVGGSPVSMRVWAPSTVYALNEYLIPTEAKRNGKFYKCTTAGTSGTTEPTWPASSTVADNTVVWTYQSTTSSAGFSIQSVMQSMLDDVMGAGVVTLYTPTPPSFDLSPWQQSREQLLPTLRRLALLFGGDVRYRWKAADSEFALTVIVPDRTPGAAVRTFAASEYKALPRLSQDIQGIRNAVDLVYSDASDLDPTGQPKRKKVSKTNSASITAYGRLWMEIAESSSSQIDSSAEANVMAQAAVDDLCEPDVDQSMALVHGFPWAELGDYYAFSANDRHYDAEQTLAVYSIEHEASGGSIQTTIHARGLPSAGRDRWHEASTAAPAPLIEAHRLDLFTSFAGITYTATPIVGGVRLELTTAPHKTAFEEEYEFHISTSSSFTPSDSTLVAVGRQRSLDVADLTPGTTYYTKVVPRTRNASRILRAQPSAETSFVAGRAAANHIKAFLDLSRRPLNSSFETRTDPAGLPDWWLKDGAGTITLISDANGSSGANYVSLVNTAGSTLSIYSAPFEVRGGQNYDLHVWHKEATAPSTFALYIVWFDYTATEADATTGQISSANVSITTSATWAKFASAGATAPATARFARIAVLIDDAAARTVYLDGVGIVEA